MKRDRTPPPRGPPVPARPLGARSVNGPPATTRGFGNTYKGTASTSAPARAAPAPARARQPPTVAASASWAHKAELLEALLAEARREESALVQATAAMEAAIDATILECDDEVAAARWLAEDDQRRHDEDRADLNRRIGECESTAARLRAEGAAVEAETQRLEETTIIRSDETQEAQAAFDGLLPALTAAEATTQAAHEHLDGRQQLVKMMRSSTYGLSEDAAALVTEDERLKAAMEAIRTEAIRTEVERRHLFGLYEELKGTIRVYCRVKGVTDPAAAMARYTFPEAAATGDAPRDSDRSKGSTGSECSLDSTRRAFEKRSLTLTHARDNATSTGKRESHHSFQYDRVYTPQSVQGDVFADVGPLIDCAVDGYRVCILAYGQTGSGKTYTMEGVQGDAERQGIIPRAIDKVFARAAQLAEDGWDTKVTCYFVEIYNDTIRDLLETSDAYHRAFSENSRDAGKQHDIQHRGRVDTVITGVTERLVRQPADVHKLLAVAVNNRSVARTLMNERSSRSHCVFTMRIEGTNARINQRSLGNLCLVDLAGSERVNESGVQGQQLKEAVNINKSLSFLGDCIVTLGSGGVVSWRICKLTYLLQNYLGGDGSKVLMIVNVSEREEHTSESVNTLRFATKVNQTHIAKANKRVQNM